MTKVIRILLLESASFSRKRALWRGCHPPAEWHTHKGRDWESNSLLLFLESFKMGTIPTNIPTSRNKMDGRMDGRMDANKERHETRSVYHLRDWRFQSRKLKWATAAAALEETKDARASLSLFSKQRYHIVNGGAGETIPTRKEGVNRGIFIIMSSASYLWNDKVTMEHSGWHPYV